MVKMTMTMAMTILLLMIITLMETTAAQPHCDPQTQYEVHGQCCQMCSLGTRMLNQGSCEEPKCDECGENEYQDEYTHSASCKRQPYCDPNKNFQKSDVQNKKKQMPCLCNLGFHCSSEQCLTCVPHTSCKPGHGAVSKGNQTHDTVCQKCPEGTFSSNDSWDGVCERHTECQNGYHVKESGTDESDNICENMRSHIWAIAISVAVGIFVVAALTLFFCRGNAKRGVKGCVESCRGETWEIPGVPVPMTPEDDDEGKDTGPVRLLSQEEGISIRTPVEDLDELSAEMSVDPSRTENGNYVGQEMGKAETLSRQESQTEPLARQLSQTHTFMG